MTSGAYRFGPFLFDCRDRQLRRGGVPVDLGARYIDALALLVREGGRLVSKDRFMTEVWRGVPVTDEALTQCVRALRKALGDDAAHPRFIETVPKHGYRFIAPLEAIGDAEPSRAATASIGRAVARRPAMMAGAGAVGGGVAGAVGGLVYGFTFEAAPGGSGAGGASLLIVLLCVCALVGMIGGAGVGGGIAAARAISGATWRWAAAGGAAGGLVVGAVVKLLGLDAFDLLLGRSPGDVTGAVEGLALGTAVGVGGWVGSLGGPRPLRRRVGVAGLSGGLTGVAIALAGGRLMGGSLDLLARGFPGSRLRIDQIGRLFGESGLGPTSLAVTAGVEGALFAGCVVGAMILADGEKTAAGRLGNPAAAPGRS